MLKEYTVPATGYDLAKTMECGQYFRNIKVGNVYLLLQGDKYCLVTQDATSLKLAIPEEPTEEETNMSAVIWKEFLDVNDLSTRDMSNFLYCMNSTPFLREALDFSSGLHILHQDPWECLITFILSQRNSVERIKQCVDNICWAAGEPFDIPNIGLFYKFPRPEALVPSILHDSGLGYRERYVYNTAKEVASKSLVLSDLIASHASLKIAIQRLMCLNGVGHKVASCVSLFSLGHSCAWPVDIWIERAMQEANITYEDVSTFGKDAGLIQEYIYYYVTHRDKIRVY